MRKVLISVAMIASLNLTGCSIIPENWTLFPDSWLHRIDVQQGNVITQDMVDQLKPGMTKRQVRFVMGTPLIVDVFHQDRWDYLYSFSKSGGEPERQQVTLFFENDRLVRTTGDLAPSENSASPEPAARHVSVVVPPQSREQPGLLQRLWDTITFKKKEEI